MPQEKSVSRQEFYNFLDTFTDYFTQKVGEEHDLVQSGVSYHMHYYYDDTLIAIHTRLVDGTSEYNIYD